MHLHNAIIEAGTQIRTPPMLHRSPKSTHILINGLSKDMFQLLKEVQKTSLHRGYDKSEGAVNVTGVSRENVGTPHYAKVLESVLSTANEYGHNQGNTEPKRENSEEQELKHSICTCHNFKSYSRFSDNSWKMKHPERPESRNDKYLLGGTSDTNITIIHRKYEYRAHDDQNETDNP
ncbi:hypothetical protein Tco_0404264 [Tanacetum coccineum]